MMAAPRLMDRRTRAEIIRLEDRARRSEDAAFATRVRHLGGRIHLAVVADRPDIALASAGEIVALSDRRLRQIGGDAA